MVQTTETEQVCCLTLVFSKTSSMSHTYDLESSVSFDQIYNGLKQHIVICQNLAFLHSHIEIKYLLSFKVAIFRTWILKIKVLKIF